MAKKTDETVEPEVTQYVPNGTRWEATVFLLDPKGAKSCIKAVGDAEVLDEIKAVTEHFYAAGYTPDSFSNKSSQAQAPAQASLAPGEKPKSFKDVNGQTWWINKSKFGDDFYIAHKNQDGTYSKLNWNEAPEFVRKAYGK